MTKSEKQIREENIINDIKAGMTNAQLFEKYGLKERAIQRRAKAAGITRKSNQQVQVLLDDDTEKTGGASFSEDESTVEDLQDQNDNLKDELVECQKHIAALEATVNELKADTAQINTATIGYIVPDEDHYIIGVKPFDDVPGVPPKAYNLEEALELFRKYRPMMAEDQVMDTLKNYGHTDRNCGKIYFKASSGSSINGYNIKFNEINERLDKLEKRVSAIEEQL